MYYLYLHTFPNNKVYIGITKTSPRVRWNNGKGYRQQPLVYRAIKKYGWNNIKHEVILESNNYEFIQQEERRYITEIYHSHERKFGYNIQLGGLYEGYSTNYIKKKVRKKLLGEKNHNYGKHWYTNGITNVYCKECPEGYKPGAVIKKRESSPTKGKQAWNNGKVTKYCNECPGKGWVRGIKPLSEEQNQQKQLKRKQTMLKKYGVEHSNYIPRVKKIHSLKRLNKVGLTHGMKWFNNGQEQTLAKTCPKGWVPGMLPINHAKKWYNNGKKEVLSIKAPDSTWKLGRLLKLK